MENRPTKDLLKPRKPAQWEIAEAQDTFEKSRVNECKRLAQMLHDYPEARLYWLRCALLHNAARHGNHATVCSLYPYTIGKGE